MKKVDPIKIGLFYFERRPNTLYFSFTEGGGRVVRLADHDLN